jgi:hypothetical protein
VEADATDFRRSFEGSVMRPRRGARRVRSKGRRGHSHVSLEGADIAERSAVRRQRVHRQRLSAAAQPHLQAALGCQPALESALCFNFDQTANAAIAIFRRSPRTHSFARLNALFAEPARNRS